MSNEFETIIYTHEESVATIKLNRPGRLNAINQKMGEELLEVLHECKEDINIKVVVITGEGNIFCGGGDIKEMKIQQEKGTPDAFFELLDEFHKLIKLMNTLGKPTICGVNGLAFGAGMNLALHCDFVVASEEAVFNEAFLKIGLSPDSGGTRLLPRFVGIRRSMEILVLSEDITASKALEYGLVNFVVPSDQLEEKFSELAQTLVKSPGIAFKATKKLIQSSLNQDLKTQLEMEKEMIILSSRSDDFEEGLTAFFEKRKPKFQGK